MIIFGEVRIVVWFYYIVRETGKGWLNGNSRRGHGGEFLLSVGSPEEFGSVIR